MDVEGLLASAEKITVENALASLLEQLSEW